MHAGSAEEMAFRAEIHHFVMQNQKTFRAVDDAFIINNVKKAHSAVLFRKSASKTNPGVLINAIAPEKAQSALQAARKPMLDSHIPAIVRTQTFLRTGFQDVRLIHATPIHASRENHAHTMN